MVERVTALPLGVLPQTMGARAGSGHSPVEIYTARGQSILSC